MSAMRMYVLDAIISSISKILRASAKHWLTTLTLLLAIVGGVPGVISIYDYFQEKAAVAISVLRFDTGELQWSGDSNRFSYLLLEMEVFNDTEKSIPLPPKPFELTIKINGHWVRLLKTTIPLVGTVLYTALPDQGGSNIDHMDLQKFRELNSGRLYGHFQPTVRPMPQYLGSKHYILFLSKEVDSEQIRGAITDGLRNQHLPMRMEWRDVRGELHEAHLASEKARITTGCYKVL